MNFKQLFNDGNMNSIHALKGCPYEASNFSDGRTQKNLNPNKVEKSKSTKLGRFHFFDGLVLYDGAQVRVYYLG